MWQVNCFQKVFSCSNKYVLAEKQLYIWFNFKPPNANSDLWQPLSKLKKFQRLSESILLATST